MAGKDLRSPGKVSRRGVLAAAAKATLAGGALGLGTAPATARAEGEAPDVVGSWMVSTATQRNGTLVTFIPGGAFIRTGVTFKNETPGHGAWEQVGDWEYIVTYLTVQVDDKGQISGYRKSWIRLTLDPSGQTFTAQSEGAALDKDGKGQRRPNNQLFGVRMVAEP